MEKINSFKKNHDALMVGFYLSQVQKGVSTFDLRFKKPNGGDYIAVSALHTIEHLVATTLRNDSLKDNVIYFGPMGCRTGFYLLTVEMDESEVKNYLIAQIKEALKLSEIPGNKREECGNYLDHDLAGAKEELKAYLKALEG